MLMEFYLEGLPHQLDVAPDGQAAVQAFQARDYDLVLMDIQMPVMDGYAATRAIRRWEKKTSREPTPILALTAHAMKEQVEESLQAGCTAHIRKPVDRKTLLKALEEYVREGSCR